MHLKIRNRNFALTPERTTPVTEHWDRYETNTYQKDHQRLTNAMSSFEAPADPDPRLWKDFVTVAAHLAEAHGVTYKQFCTYVAHEFAGVPEPEPTGDLTLNGVLTQWRATIGQADAQVNISCGPTCTNDPYLVIITSLDDDRFWSGSGFAATEDEAARIAVANAESHPRTTAKIDAVLGDAA